MGDIAQYTSSGCPSLVGVDVRARPNCAQINAFVLDKLSEKKPEWVVLHNNWIASSGIDFEAGLRKTLAAIRQRSSASQIVVIGSVPQWDHALPVMMVRRHIDGADGQAMLENTSIDQLVKIDKVLSAVTLDAGGKFMSAIDALCVAAECRATVLHNGHVMPTAWDYGHLTEGGAGILARRLSSLW